MKTTEYFESIDGQANRRQKRRSHTNYLVIQQEPKSKKSISKEEKFFFRKEILKQLGQRGRRAHTGDIILEIDFYTTKDNPPALHTLTKNYLDLLHKEDAEVDNLKGLLFKDDSQIKILIANYHLANHSNKYPEIIIRSYPLSYFIADVELTDRINCNRFSDSDSSRHMRFINEIEREDSFFKMSDYHDDLIDLEKDREDWKLKFGEPFYDLQRHFLIRQVQEKYLNGNEFGIIDLNSIFRHLFSYNRKYIHDISFHEIWNITRGLIFFTSDFLELGNPPRQEGETKIFKSKVKEQLEIFKQKHKILFPLLHPINLTITFIPPKNNIVDLDNLARYIVPFVNEVFQPPITHSVSYDNKYLNKILQKEVNFLQKFPPHSITGYQLIHIPRKENDPENGKIDFVITDGFMLRSNIWNMVDQLIDRWEKKY